MSDSTLRRYLEKPANLPEGGNSPAEDLDDLGAFGFLRGTHDRALMLELRYKDGNIDAFPYAWLGKASFDPSKGITLRFGAETVKITGRNLNSEARPNVRLFAALVRHRIPWIQETSESQVWKAECDAAVVDAIKVK